MHLLVYYDGSPGAQRGLLAAAGLAKAGLDGVTVLLGSGNQIDAMVENELDVLRKNVEIRYLRFDSANKMNLLKILKAEKNGMLVLGNRKFLDKLPSLDEFLRETEMPPCF